MFSLERGTGEIGLTHREHTSQHRACLCRMKKENGRSSGGSCNEVVAVCGCCCRCCCSGSSSSFVVVVIVIVLSLCGSRCFVLFEPPSSWTVSFYVDKEFRCTNKRRRRPSPPRTTTTTTTMSVFVLSIVWLFVEAGEWLLSSFVHQCH